MEVGVRGYGGGVRGYGGGVRGYGGGGEGVWRGGEGVWRWGKREIMYLSLHCHHQNDSCIKMDSDESRFNVSFTVRDKVTKQCPQTTTFEEKG